MKKLSKRMLLGVASVALSYCFAFAPPTAHGNQPVAEMPARKDGLATVFTVSGKLEAVARGGDRIGFFSNKPFWGPPHRGWEKIALWPADTLLVLFVAAPTPVTIDGKKARPADLAAGQEVTVQYQITEGIAAGMACTAVRIDARTASSGNKKSETRSPRKHQ